MTIQQCYEKLGGNYEEVFQRFRSEQFIRKFMLRFPDDRSFQSLLAAMECGDGKEAFLAAHTLKGVSQNLGFTELYEASHELTEALRGEATDGKEELLDAVKVSYEKTVSAIGKYQEENE